MWFLLFVVANAICSNFMVWTFPNKDNCRNCILAGYRYNTTCFYMKSRRCLLVEESLPIILANAAWYEPGRPLSPAYVWNAEDCY